MILGVFLLFGKLIIETIVCEPEAGAMYYGKVTRILPIGAMVEILNTKYAA